MLWMGGTCFCASSTLDMSVLLQDLTYVGRKHGFCLASGVLTLGKWRHEDTRAKKRVFLWRLKTRGVILGGGMT